LSGGNHFAAARCKRVCVAEAGETSIAEKATVKSSASMRLLYDIKFLRNSIGKSEEQHKRPPVRSVYDACAAAISERWLRVRGIVTYRNPLQQGL
jgi:hypothetical protein